VNFSPVISALGGLRDNVALRGMALSFSLRIGTTGLSFLLIWLAARTLDEHNFGTYSMLFSAAGLCSVVATLGQQIFLMRAWSEYTSAERPDLLKGAMLFSLLACVGGGALIGLSFYAWFTHSHEAFLTSAVMAYFVSMAILLTTSHLSRTAIGNMVGDGLSALLVILPPVGYLSVCVALNRVADTGLIFLTMAVGATVALLAQLALTIQKTLTLFPGFLSIKPEFSITDWRDRSLKLWISNSLEAANQYADVVIIGFLMSPTVAGAYFVTTRIANAFAVASTALYLFSTRHISNLYYAGRRPQLDALLDTAAFVTLGIIAAGLLLILSTGHWILGLFSPEYEPYYAALALLTVGTAAVTAAGSSGSILMLTGHEGRYLKIIGCAIAMRTVGFFVLIPLFNITGAVVATTISFIWMALMLRRSAKQLAGLDGSVLRLFGWLQRRNVPASAE